MARYHTRMSVRARAYDLRDATAFGSPIAPFSLVDHRVRAAAGPPVPLSPTRMSRAPVIITSDQCERYDAISHGDVADASDDEERQRSSMLSNEAAIRECAA